MENGMDFETALQSFNLYDMATARQVYQGISDVEWEYVGHPEEAPYKLKYKVGKSYAARVVADLRNAGEDYTVFYLHGNEGRVSNLVKKVLGSYGWKPVNSRLQN